MHAEIIAIGDEIASGQLLDTNSQVLSRRLEEMGVRVLYHSTVGDALEPCADVFRRAIERADLVIATGGLGPTADDLTREALALATGRKLMPDLAALEHIRRLFARRNRPMPAPNEKQALFPEGSRVIHNPNGTAPGIDLLVPRADRRPSRFLALPGVPAEIDEMWHDSVGQTVLEYAGGARVIRHRAIKCFGAGESQIETMLPDLIRRGRYPSVGINASKTTIILRIAAEGATAEEACSAMEPTVATIRQCLGNLIFGEGDDELQNAVGRLLRSHHATLATVEWGTAGLVAEWLGEAREGDGHYLGGLVVRSEEAASRALGISRELLQCHAAASSEVVQAMAASCRERFGADYALAVGPFPEPHQSPSPPAEVYFALAAPSGVHVRVHPLAGHPATVNIFCAKTALNFARLAMLS
ncbi:MAG: CinA family nicotinamide mononucleotide deamidase-related protein [Thermoguttaceae bacterium]|jgi:nicotinamide-nucleotide amidase|nr:CinA family nicotinamide mononucleotide deamidase-related protein [Thermoguttaceae bacterium]